jgi:hypothetical protein
MKSNSTWISFSALGIGLAVVLISAAFGIRQNAEAPSSRAHSSEPGGTPTSDPEVLSRRSQDLGEEATPKSSPTPAPRQPSLRSTMKERLSGTWEPGEASAQARELRRGKLQTAVLDESAEPMTRVRDLVSLHQMNGITPAVEESMFKLLRGSDNAVVRERVLIGLEGATSDLMKAEALRLIQGDPAPRVRKAAARALYPMKADPLVQSALQTVLKIEPDRDVRREAERTLTRTERRFGEPKQDP